MFNGNFHDDGYLITLMIAFIGIVIPALFYLLTRHELRRHTQRDTELYDAMTEFLKEADKRLANSEIQHRSQPDSRR